MADSGHYIGFGKIADGRWIQYDDHRVQEMKARLLISAFAEFLVCSLWVRRMQFSGLMAVPATAQSRTYVFTRQRSWPPSGSEL
jgi:hypothetical protein